MARTFGSDMIQRLNEGSLQVAPSEYLAKVRDEVSEALEELIEAGARVRPLFADGKRIGWVRGVHVAERRIMKRWGYDTVDFTEHLIRLATTLTPDEIQDLSLVEVRSIVRLIQNMTESDLRLFSYVSPFVTTSTSERLWYALGVGGSLFRARELEMPDGKRMRLLAAPDQANLWAYLANQRIIAIAHLQSSANAVMMVRAWVGKGADQITHSLKMTEKNLQTNSFDPWKDIIRVRDEAQFNDGWAHSNDDSIEGMLRELKGMNENDRHEQVVSKVFAEEEARSVARQVALQEQIARRNETAREEAEASSGFTIMTEADVQAQRAEWAGKNSVALIDPEEQPQSNFADRLANYR